MPLVLLIILCLFLPSPLFLSSILSSSLPLSVFLSRLQSSSQARRYWQCSSRSDWHWGRQCVVQDPAWRSRWAGRQTGRRYKKHITLQHTLNKWFGHGVLLFFWGVVTWIEQPAKLPSVMTQGSGCIVLAPSLMRESKNMPVMEMEWNCENANHIEYLQRWLHTMECLAKSVMICNA